MLPTLSYTLAVIAAYVTYLHIPKYYCCIQQHTVIFILRSILFKELVLALWAINIQSMESLNSMPSSPTLNSSCLSPNCLVQRALLLSAMWAACVPTVTLPIFQHIISSVYQQAVIFNGVEKKFPFPIIYLLQVSTPPAVSSADVPTYHLAASHNSLSSSYAPKSSSLSPTRLDQRALLVAWLHARYIRNKLASKLMAQRLITATNHTNSLLKIKTIQQFE